MTKASLLAHLREFPHMVGVRTFMACDKPSTWRSFRALERAGFLRLDNDGFSYPHFVIQRLA